MFWHFSFATRGKQKRDPWDYRWTLAAKRSSLFFYFFVCRSTLNAKEKKHILMQFSMGARQKGQEAIFYIWVPFGHLSTMQSALKIDFTWSIELKFIWYWAKVKIFWWIPSLRFIIKFLFVAHRIVITAYAAFMISIYISSSIIIS